MLTTFPVFLFYLFHTLVLEICAAGELAWNLARSDNTGELMNRGRGRRNDPIVHPGCRAEGKPSEEKKKKRLAAAPVASRRVIGRTSAADGRRAGSMAADTSRSFLSVHATEASLCTLALWCQRTCSGAFLFFNHLQSNVCEESETAPFLSLRGFLSQQQLQKCRPKEEEARIRGSAEEAARSHVPEDAIRTNSPQSHSWDTNLRTPSSDLARRTERINVSRQETPLWHH